jgi:hypothetical protein
MIVTGAWPSSFGTRRDTVIGISSVTNKYFGTIFGMKLYYAVVKMTT